MNHNDMNPYFERYIKFQDRKDGSSPPGKAKVMEHAQELAKEAAAIMVVTGFNLEVYFWILADALGTAAVYENSPIKKKYFEDIRKTILSKSSIYGHNVD